MLRQSEIAAAFRESVSGRKLQRIPVPAYKGFVSALRRRGIHFTEVEANSGSHASRRISSIRRRTIAKTGCG